MPDLSRIIHPIFDTLAHRACEHGALDPRRENPAIRLNNIYQLDHEDKKQWSRSTLYEVHFSHYRKPPWLDNFVDDCLIDYAGSTSWFIPSKIYERNK